jgi:hypothetical protein
MKKLKSLVFLIMGLILFSGCSDQEEESETVAQSQVVLSLKTTSSFVIDPEDPTQGLPLDLLQISISNIVFRFVGNEDGTGDESTYEPELLESPFLIDLLSKEAFSGEVLGNSDVPNGILGQIEWSFEPYQGDGELEIDGYSIFGKGTYNDQPIVIKSDRSEPVDIEFIGDIEEELSGKKVNLVIDFNLDKLLASLLNIGTIGVTDGNEDGIFEINTDGTDGNEVLANLLVNAIENAFQLKVDE